MRSRIEAWLDRIWYGDEPAPWWLRGLSPLYRRAFLIHRSWSLARRPDSLRAVPIVVVGNITAGGTGKTPLVIRLCRILGDAGLRPGVVTRGYGRRGNGVTAVRADSTAAEVGDEALLIAQRARVPVMVSADRCLAAQALLAASVDVIVSDDGLQHHRLPRSLEICVVDAERGFGNGRLIPAGPLREPLSRLAEVDAVVLNLEQGSASTRDDVPGAVPMQLQPGLLRSLADGQTWRAAQFAGCRANAAAGIGNPERFFRSLEQSGLKLNRYPFSDHHEFRPSDFETMEPGLPLIMTEKDAVKCRGMALENAWYLSVEASLPTAWEVDVVRRLRAAKSAEGARP